MITDVWTSEQFRQNTKSKSIFGRRKALLKAIEKALDEAHAKSSQPGEGLTFVEIACNKWLQSHPDTSLTPAPGKKTSSRRKGIETLLGQIKAKRKALYGRTPQQQLEAQQILSRYETSDKVLNIGPGGVDPRLMKGRAGFHHELLEATIDRATELQHEKTELNTEQLGFLAAKSALKIDAVIDEKNKAACKTEALRILCAMLGKSRQLAMQFESTGIEVVVVPKDRPMTDLPEFASLKDVPITQEGGTPRLWNETRGVGALTVTTPTGTQKMYVAVTEENLLGTPVGPLVSAVGGGCYAKRYSTTSHEFAHGLHRSGATTAEQKATILACFKRKKSGIRIDAANSRIFVDEPSFLPTQVNLDAVFSREWADGPRRMQAPVSPNKLYWVQKGTAYVMNPLSPTTHFQYSSLYTLQDCYSAFDEAEYFAQLVNAYLGANGGSDPYTGRARHNGESWVRANEPPEMVRLLDELFSSGATNHFGQARVNDTNDDGVDEPTVADYIKMRVAGIKNKKHLQTALASRRTAMGYDEDDD